MPKPRPSIATAASDLHDAVEALERLSERLDGLNLPTWTAISRGGQLLDEGVGLHQRFVTALEQLSRDVSTLRDRHNACADRLSQHATRIDARRTTYQALEQRFGALAEAGRETDALLRAIPTESDADPTARAAAVSAGFAAVRERIARAADEARAVASEAREAGLTDLESQAAGVGEQLDGMLKAIARSAPDANPS